ncbi:hypothetical protein SMSP2_02819 [Limihaloglobus sulfuriphilus]|uniref:Uncharacterized protein n=1 Tax=Limihaloglobus sulfuriphilus TaxID=1851148 RepID=A0A1Q2MI99_9BACT|nr:hypothetical protein [Limihaloglobus sulfuriphilus]AQQ72435.1 hypothetical protein SMSP2_02819 [Limihaloglobus sulfuriphilus]
MASNKSNVRRRIGEPLTLPALEELGYIKKGFECLPGPMSADKWSGQYQIFISKGMTTLPTSPVGKVFISALSDSKEVNLKVESFLINENPGSEPTLHRTKAVLVCNNDPVCSLKDYSASIEFRTPEGKLIEALSHDVEARYRWGRCKCRAGKISVSNKVKGPLSSYWSLMHAARGLAEDELPEKAFSVFEDSGLIRSGQYLRLKECRELQTGSGNLRLKCCSRRGAGILPVEYWTDTQGRFIAMISSSLVYVFDSMAAEALPPAVEAQIQKMREE